MSPDEYLRNVRNYRSLMRTLAEFAQPDPDHVARLRAAGANAGVERVSLMTEDWCGDSACNVPILARLFEQAGLPFAIVRGSEMEKLKQRYEDDGDDHIPVVSLWRGDGTEVVRWVEAPEAVQKRKEEWKAAHPEFATLYERRMEGDSAATKEFGRLYRRFLEEMADWYRNGLWSETTREVVEAVEEAVDRRTRDSAAS